MEGESATHILMQEKCNLNSKTYKSIMTKFTNIATFVAEETSLIGVYHDYFQIIKKYPSWYISVGNSIDKYCTNFYLEIAV